MSRGVVVNDIINETRSLVDEFNVNQLSDTADILPSLNRGQEKATKILKRVYPDPLLLYVELTNVNTREFTLPEEMWEDAVVRMEWITGGGNVVPKECQRVVLRTLAQFETGLPNIDRPEVHSIYGRKVRFNGVPNGRSTLRIWYVRSVDTLVKTYARITQYTEGDDTLYLQLADTSWNTDLGNTYDGDWGSYFNVIDGQTGEIKGSFQATHSTVTDSMQVRAIPDRTKVLDYTISTSLLGLNINADDYICPIKGTCVQYFFDAFHTFCIQYAVAELKRKLGYAYDADQQLLTDFESELKKTYAGRSLMMRIAANNPNWLKGSQRRFYRGFKY